MSSSDQTLLDDFDRDRDEASFRKLYRRHTPMIFALAVRLSGSREEAEELTQEAWVRAIERHETFEGQSRYSTWLAGIVVNCAREAARRRARTTRMTDDYTQAADSVAGPLPKTLQSPSDPIDVERALSRLPSGYREVVILHDLNGHTHREIASMLNIQVGTSKSQLMRGRARLRALLREYSSAFQVSDERGTSCEP